MPNYIRDGRAPIPKNEHTSRVMRANKAKDTNPELALVSGLRKLKIKGYTRHPKNIPGRPDVAFRLEHLAVFVHGCFWHRHTHCFPSIPKTHQKYWVPKFEANVRRDARKRIELNKLGWSILTVWECQLKKDPIRQAMRVQNRLARIF